MPSCGAQAAVGADGSASGSDSDANADHDFTADGVLPAAMVNTESERAAQMAAYYEVSSIIGMADIKSRYPKQVHFLHKVDGAGERNNSEAMMLIPTHASPGVKIISLGESTAFRSGSYMEVPVPS